MIDVTPSGGDFHHLGFVSVHECECYSFLSDSKAQIMFRDWSENPRSGIKHQGIKRLSISSLDAVTV